MITHVVPLPRKTNSDVKSDEQKGREYSYAPKAAWSRWPCETIPSVEMSSLLLLLNVACALFAAGSSNSSNGITSPYLPGSHPYPQLPGGSTSQLPGIASLSPLRQRVIPPPLALSGIAAASHPPASPGLQRHHHKAHMRRAVPSPLSPVVTGTRASIVFRLRAFTLCGDVS